VNDPTVGVPYDPIVEWGKLDAQFANYPLKRHVTFRLSPDEMERGFLGEVGPDDGVFIYERLGHPETWLLEKYCAAMEHTEAACCVGSGQAVITTLLDACCRPGDSIVASNRLYGGTIGKLKKLFEQRNITVTFVDISDLDEVCDAMGTKTRLVLAETTSNPTLLVANIPLLSAIVHQFGALLAIDNTFTPLIVLPVHHGADIVWHSLTKFVSGKSDIMAGVICANRELTERFRTERTFNGGVLHYQEATKLRKRFSRLPDHLKKHGILALAVAGYLKDCGYVVHYPGLPSDPGHELFRSLMHTEKFGYGGVVTLDLHDAGRAKHLATAMDKSGFAISAVSLGSIFTYVCAPLSAVLCALRDEVELPEDLSPGLVRIAMGHSGRKETVLRRLSSALDIFPPTE